MAEYDAQILSFLIVSIIFCLLTFEIEYFIISHTATNTTAMLIKIAFHGNTKLIGALPIENAEKIANTPRPPRGIPIIKDFMPYIRLSRRIIRLNSFFVIPIDLSDANSLLLNCILVEIVLKIFVIPISEITPMKPVSYTHLTLPTKLEV